MRRVILNVLLAFGHYLHANAQTSYDASQCIPGSGVTALSNCNKMSDELVKCNGTSTEADLAKCWCNQDVFNVIFE
jgi:hypothetical protein